MDLSSSSSEKGSIVNELYSETLPSSSFEFDRGCTAVQGDGTLNESDDGDLWYDDGSSCEDSIDKLNRRSDMDREWNKRRNQFHTIGYRDGLIAGKEFAAQEGFNIGFKDSVFVGYNLGLVRGITSAMACLPSTLKEKLVETKEARNKFQALHESVQSLSTKDALKLYYEVHKRKLESAELNATTRDSSHQSPDVSVFCNYYVQLRSLLSESPLIEGKLRLN